MEKYGMTLRRIQRCARKAAEIRQTGMTFERLVYSGGLDDYTPDECAIIGAFFDADVIDAAERVFYRIGEPTVNQGGYYLPSWNSAEDKREIGVSVITLEWLHSLKSVLFGAHDEDTLRTRGVYRITGVLIGYGGDGEPLIIPTQWAKKTRIRTYAGLEKAVKTL